MTLFLVMLNMCTCHLVSFVGVRITFFEIGANCDVNFTLRICFTIKPALFGHPTALLCLGVVIAFWQLIVKYVK